MRWFTVIALCLGPSVSLAQQPPAPVKPQANASSCKSICVQGETDKLTGPDDKTLYFSCFLEGYCGGCKEAGDSKHLCNPIARQPPAGSPWDIIQRSIDGRV